MQKFNTKQVNITGSIQYSLNVVVIFHKIFSQFLTLPQICP